VGTHEDTSSGDIPPRLFYPVCQPCDNRSRLAPTRYYASLPGSAGNCWVREFVYRSLGSLSETLVERGPWAGSPAAWQAARPAAPPGNPLLKQYCGRVGYHLGRQWNFGQPRFSSRSGSIQPPQYGFGCERGVRGQSQSALQAVEARQLLPQQ